MPRDPSASRRRHDVTLIALLIAALAGYPGHEAAAQTPAPKPIDPRDAAAGVRFVAEIRPAEMLRKQPAWKILSEQYDQIKFGTVALKAAEIDQVLVLGVDRTPEELKRPEAMGVDNFPPQVVVVVRLNRAIDWKAAMPEEFAPIKRDGVTYYARITDPAGAACTRPLDDRTLLIALPGDMIRPPIGVEGPRVAHAWDDAWKSAGSGQFRVAFETSWVLAQWNDDLNPPLGLRELLGPLLNGTTTYGIGVDVADGLALEVVASSKSEADAETVAGTARALLAQLDEMMKETILPNVRGTNPPGNDFFAQIRAANKPSIAILAFADGLEKAVAERKVGRAGTRVEFRARLEQKAVNSLIEDTFPDVKPPGRGEASNRLKQLAVAMLNYEAKHDAFPPAVLIGPDGKTPHSWRVAILPFLGEEKLYAEYKLDEPWDGPNNRKLIDRMPAVFGHPAAADDTTHPAFFALVGPSTTFATLKERPINIKAGAPGEVAAPRVRQPGVAVFEIMDGMATTILLVEAKREIPWTKPEDIPYAADKPIPDLGGFAPGGFIAATVNGAVRPLKSTVAAETLRALITRDGGEVVTWPD